MSNEGKERPCAYAMQLKTHNSSLIARQRLLHPLIALVRQLQLFDRDLVRGCVDARAVDFGWPGVHEIPARNLSTLLAEEHDRAVFARLIDFAFLDQLPPLPHIHVVGDALLERDVA